MSHELDGDGSHSVGRLRLIDSICDRFEAAWSAGTPLSIEALLTEVDEGLRPALLRELLATEVQLRRRRGDCPAPEEYLAKFPGFDKLVHSAFLATMMGDPSEEKDTSSHPSAPPDLPGTIGRHRVIRLLGEGGFGRVYLAQDDDLKRSVAIKVPRSERIKRPENVEAYLAEAQILARLEHPGIVPVYEAGRTEEGLLFVVSKFIEGTDLAGRLKRAPFSHREAAELVATVAEALHYAHSRHLVHRDVKPANILMDDSGRPYVADFGMALKDEDYGKGSGFAGTPAYMSPEQARGEGHRVDGRSDVFSLGVVFYELLSGQRPFRGVNARDVMEEIAESDARPPRQFVDTIPRELERICLKALSKRATERYTTAGDMAEDLRHFLKSVETQGPSPAAPAPAYPPPSSTIEATPLPPTSGRPDSDPRPIKVVPKGLRSFDEHDADFFLELLPGVRDRDGLPEGLRFWKTRIEILDPDRTFKVGLIYGPSGCGKSSMVKAGLIPRLAKHIRTVYLEATPEETESRLLRGLRKVCPDLPGSLGLVESVASIRRGRVLGNGQKVLLILDQFEQWLFARRTEQDAELVAALRQCDGEHIQAIVMVRDDFWMAVTRFMRDLEIRILEGENSAAVDLFEPRHASRVLTAFGRAYGALPENPSDMSPEQKAFTDQSIAGLARDGKVVSVRLALFAEMVKGKPWTPATWRQVGGTKGVGVTFLEETFGLTTAPPEHRLHQKAAQAILKSLLPATGTDIKGEMRSEAELRDASGYASRPRDFDELIRILDAELRLITPTDPEGSDDDGTDRRPAGGRYFQFTHDYLVPSIREWLTRKQRETRRGRAELKLAERSATWNVRPEDRQLPSVVEWATIRMLTRRKDWTEQQRRMIRRSERVLGLRTMGLAFFLAIVSWGGIEGYGDLRASALVESLKSASTTDVPPIIEQLSGYRRWANARLARLLRDSELSTRDHLHASLALLPVDGSQVDYLYQRLLAARPDDVKVLREALRPQAPTLTTKLWSVIASSKPNDTRLLPAASALALYDLDRHDWDQVCPRIAQAMVAVNPEFIGAWINNLSPIRSKLNPTLATIVADRNRVKSERSLATSILVDYARDDPGALADLLMDAEPKVFSIFFPIAENEKWRSKVLSLLQVEVDRRSGPSATIEDKDRLAARKARAAVALVRMGKAEKVWPLLQHSADPRLRSFLVNWLSPLGADPRLIVAELNQIDPKVKPDTAPGPQMMEAVLFHRETSMRRALILALGTYGMEGLSPAEREPLIAKLLELYQDDPDAGIHGSAEWTLRQWGQSKKLILVDANLMNLRVDERGHRRWYVNGQGQTFAVINGPVQFLMGCPPTDPAWAAAAPQRQHSINRSFAVATKEVTHEQLLRFRSSGRFGRQNDPRVSWYDAAAYCNWLSEREGLDKDQWCYEPNAEGKYDDGMRIVPGVLKRRGYRLPEEAEWEYACRAGATTSRYYGDSLELLEQYARYGYTDLRTSGAICSLWLYRFINHYSVIWPLQTE